jgi:capsid portal protein
MAEQKTMGLGTGALPPPPPLPLSEKLVVRSRIVPLAGERRGSTAPAPFGWLGKGIGGIMSPSLLSEANQHQRRARLAKLEPPEGPPDPRSSREDIEDYGRRAGTPGLAGQGDYVEPPFDLRRLTELLYHSPDYFATVDQMSLDVAGEWLLVDRDIGKAGVRISRAAMDERAALQADEAEAWLESLTSDFAGEPVTVSEFGKMLAADLFSTGNAYVEVVRSIVDGKPEELVHIPSYLIKRSAKGGYYAQVSEGGRPLAYFRRFGSDPNDPASLLDQAEARIAGRPVGSLKGELADFRRYHPAERYYGVPPIVAAFNQVAGNIFASNRNVRFFVNRAMPDYVVMIKADQASLEDPAAKKLIDDAQTMLEDHMEYMVKGQDHKTLTLLLPTGNVELEFMRVGDLPSDQEWGQYQKDNRDTILRVYRIRPEELGIIETAHLGSGTGENQAERYKRAQIEPSQTVFEDFWNGILDAGDFLLVRFAYAELDIIDEAVEITMCSAAAGTGGISVNDIRRWLSRVIKDQDFPDDEDEMASIPYKILELKFGQPMQSGGDLVRGILQQGGRPRPSGAEDLQALRARAEGPADFQARMTASRERLGLPARAPRPAAPPAPFAVTSRNGGRNGA